VPVDGAAVVLRCNQQCEGGLQQRAAARIHLAGVPALLLLPPLKLLMLLWPLQQRASALAAVYHSCQNKAAVVHAAAQYAAADRLPAFDASDATAAGTVESSEHIPAAASLVLLLLLLLLKPLCLQERHSAAC
jgi:hypothetical protein